MYVLVFYCCIINHQKGRGRTNILAHHSVGQKFSMTQLGSLLRVSQCQNQGNGRLSFYPEALEKNPLPCSFRFLGKFQSLVTPRLESTLSFQRPSTFLSICPPLSSSQQWPTESSPSQALTLSGFLFCHCQRKLSNLKSSSIWVISICIISTSVN